MAKIDKIIFSGHSWPAAEAWIPAKHGWPAITVELGATWRGKIWSTDAPQAFWRTFCELPFDGVDPDPLAAFVRRWGEPLGRLEGKGGSIRIEEWLTLVNDLRHIAEAWSREDRNGISSCSDTKRIKEATRWWREVLFPRVSDTLHPVPDPEGGAALVLRASRLSAFMAASSASALERRVPMRRCQYCKTWFELLRPDARFCRPSCRALSHKQRGTQES
jgi:hypothetical protein